MHVREWMEGYSIEFTPPQGSARDGRRVFPDPRCGLLFLDLGFLVVCILFGAHILDLAGLSASVLLIVWWVLHFGFPCLTELSTDWWSCL